MGEEETKTTTVTLPKALAEEVESVAKARGTTFAAATREGLRMWIKPTVRGRSYVPHGNTRRFNRLLDKARAEYKPLIVIVESHRTGERSFYEGTVYEALTNESILCLSSSVPALLMREEIIGSYMQPPDSPNGMIQMRQELKRHGFKSPQNL